MRVVLIVVAILFGLLGGNGTPVPAEAGVAMAHQAAGESGCAHDGQQGPQRPSAPFHGKLCCMGGWSIAAIEPSLMMVEEPVAAPLRVGVAPDDRPSSRAVSPLRRPPKTVD